MVTVGTVGTVGTVRTERAVRSVFSVLTVLTVLTVRLEAQLEAGIKVGSKAPAVVINDLEGKPVDLGSVLGKKPVLLEFWATWCPVCKGLLPELDKVKSTYGDQVALYGINVTVNDSKARIQRYLAEHHPPFQVLFDDKGAGVRAYDVPATSFIVVVDGAGKVVYTGSGEKQDLVAAVQKAVRPR
jgi:thiol-disulfide isomerase/thioredoxin